MASKVSQYWVTSTGAGGGGGGDVFVGAGSYGAGCAGSSVCTCTISGSGTITVTTCGCACGGVELLEDEFPTRKKYAIPPKITSNIKPAIPLMIPQTQPENLFFRHNSQMSATIAADVCGVGHFVIAIWTLHIHLHQDGFLNLL